MLSRSLSCNSFTSFFTFREIWEVCFRHILTATNTNCGLGKVAGSRKRDTSLLAVNPISFTILTWAQLSIVCAGQLRG